MLARTLTLTLTLALALTALPSTAAGASRGPCVPGTGGPQCKIWRAKVLAVHDGDTIDVRLGGKRRRVRITGLNAMEQTVYARDPRRRRGACHALEATGRLERYIRRGGRRVRLAAQRASSRSGSRLRRSVAVRIGGRWVDPARVLIREGRALWLPNGVEWAWNRDYSEQAELAAARGLRLWDPDACGSGPEEGARLRLWVNWDADGEDNFNPNGEFVRIKNLDPGREVAVGGWWLRDSDLRQYRFPAGAVIPAGGTITLRVGRGSPGAGEYFWGLGDAAFENVTDDERAMGDGAYLFDPQGDIRAFMTYPCRNTCSQPLPGLELGARLASPESVTLRNTSVTQLDLEGLRLTSSAHAYLFGGQSVIGPGEQMVVNVRGSASDDTRLVRHWGLSRSIFDDEGGRVRLESLAGAVLGCRAWGGETC